MQIALWPCLGSSCGPYGRCVQYFSAGLIYSACVCHSGYTGWACTDDREAMSTSLLIASVLVLTLSNLSFIPAIVLAFHRRFYPQCMMYFLTMIFSTVSYLFFKFKFKSWKSLLNRYKTFVVLSRLRPSRLQFLYTALYSPAVWGFLFCIGISLDNCTYCSSASS